MRAFASIGLALMVWASPAQALEAAERAIKAAFLLRFGFFVEWPQSAFAASDSPINLCIVGGDPFGSLLDDLVKGRKIGPRALAVRRLASVSHDSGCHIAYIAKGAEQSLHTLRGSSVLTVTDARTSDDVGIINFVMQEDRVRFSIDDDAAAAGGLVISSRLLNLALDVKPRR